MVRRTMDASLATGSFETVLTFVGACLVPIGIVGFVKFRKCVSLTKRVLMSYPSWVLKVFGYRDEDDFDFNSKLTVTLVLGGATVLGAVFLYDLIGW